MVFKKNNGIAAKVTCAALAVGIAMAALPISADARGAEQSVSPALAVLAESLSLSKSGLVGKEIVFSESDFDELVGVRVPSVTFLSLPSEEAGTVLIKGRALGAGETVYRDELDTLSFRPACDEVNDTTFEIALVGNQAYTCPCTLYMLSELNFAPTVESSPLSPTSLTSFSGIACRSEMSASDPEGDEIVYKVTEYPSHGSLITGSDGSYEYTPSECYSGKDSFSYVACDRYGGVSDPVRVTVTVKEPRPEITFSDMSGSRFETIAMTVADAGIMSGREKNGEYLFDPAETVSRAEYLTMLYSAAKITPKNIGTPSPFADTQSLPQNVIACICDALENGYISADGGTLGAYFHPSDMITRSEAAVMTAALLELDLSATSQAPLFSDSSAISTDAFDSVCSVCEIGLFRAYGGEFAPNAALTRAHAAEVLERVMRYCD